MKKSIVLTSLSLALMFVSTVGAQTVDRKVNLTIGDNGAKINGKSVTMSAPAQVVEGSTMVPLRFIGEALGCDVEWDAKLAKATVTYVDQIIEAPVGKNYAIINGDEIKVNVPAQLINGSTYVPLRFISESLGAKVDYDAKTRTIDLSMKTYINEAHGFEIIIPDGWTVGEKIAEGVEYSLGENVHGAVGFANAADEVNVNNFDEFAQGCFGEYEGQDVLDTFVNGLMAVVIFEEDGLLNIHTYKLVDDGIYFIIMASSEESINEKVTAQYDILINSLKAYKK